MIFFVMYDVGQCHNVQTCTYIWSSRLEQHTPLYVLALHVEMFMYNQVDLGVHINGDQ